MGDGSRPGPSVETACASPFPPTGSAPNNPLRTLRRGTHLVSRRIAEGRLISRPAMKAPRAWVAQLGQRRSVEVAVPQGFAGSNPAPRIAFPNPDGVSAGWHRAGVTANVSRPSFA